MAGQAWDILLGSGPFTFKEVKDAEDAFVLARRQKLFPDNPEGRKRSALCLSGGGVRSASYCLGVMKAFAEAGELKNFDHLSTVSGGGFAGAFVTRWVHEDGYKAVEDELRSGEGFNRPGSPLYHLRQYIAYLTPKMGVFGLDTVTGIALFLRNLTVNWLVLGPFLLMICALPQLISTLYNSSNSDNQETVRFWLLLVTATLVIMIGFENFRRRPAFVSTKDGILKEDKPFDDVLAGYVLPFLVLTLLIGACCFRFEANVSWLWSDTIKGIIKGVKTCSTQVGLEDCWYDLALSINGKVWIPLLLFAAFVFWQLHLANMTESSEDKGKSWTLLLRRFAANFLSLLCQMSILLIGCLLCSTLLFELEAGNSTISPSFTFQQPSTDPPQPKASQLFVVFFPFLFVTTFFFAETIYHVIQGNPKWGEQEKEWTARTGGALLLPVLLWTLLSFASFWGLGLAKAMLELLPGFDKSSTESAVVATTGIGAGFMGVVAYFLAIFERAKSLSTKGIETWKQIGTKWTLALVTAAFFFLLVSCAGEVHRNLAYYLPKLAEKMVGLFGNWQLLTWQQLILVPMIYLVFGVAVDWRVALRNYSLHGIYRNRLVRTFVGAANPERRAPAITDTPRGFLDFPPSDNIEMAKLDRLNSDLPDKQNKFWPQLHTVNMALNVPGASNLALQEHKSLPFSANCIATGSSVLRTARSNGARPGGYRKTSEYAAKGPNKLSLGTVIAISGAAFNPNMGYHGTASMRTLFTALNVRLGVWLGNPGAEGKKQFSKNGPMFMIPPLVAELGGIANERSPYVHLSDGGHFENLAVYEMLRREVQHIVVVDAGCDSEYDYEDLSVLQRLAELDLNTIVKFNPVDLAAIKSGTRNWAEGTILYRNLEGSAQHGQMFLLKPTLGNGNQPLVTAYKSKSAEFPHETTANQFFSVSQFFAYFELGVTAGSDLSHRISTLKHV